MTPQSESFVTERSATFVFRNQLQLIYILMIMQGLNIIKSNEISHPPNF